MDLTDLDAALTNIPWRPWRTSFASFIPYSLWVYPGAFPGKRRYRYKWVRCLRRQNPAVVQQVRRFVDDEVSVWVFGLIGGQPHVRKVSCGQAIAFHIDFLWFESIVPKESPEQLPRRSHETGRQLCRFFFLGRSEGHPACGHSIRTGEIKLSSIVASCGAFDNCLCSRVTSISPGYLIRPTVVEA